MPTPTLPHCFCCGIATRKPLKQATAEDGRLVLLREKCHARVRMSGPAGYQPHGDRPRIYAIPHRRPTRVD